MLCTAIPAIVEDDTEESEEVPYGIIAGVVGGAVVIVALVAVIIVIIVLRRYVSTDTRTIMYISHHSGGHRMTESILKIALPPLMRNVKEM